jgi:Uma2 family endonuclease
LALPLITENKIDPSPGDEIILRYRTWQDYEALLARYPEQAGLRIRYSHQTQEILFRSPLPAHGKNADLLADLVKALLRHQGQEWEAFPPITLKRDQRQGVEPDYCFYIQHRQQILGKTRLDLEQDPPPDLVLEVDLTARTYPEDYQAIAPPELWIYRRQALLVYQFQGQTYQNSAHSRQFPSFPVTSLIPQHINQGWEVGSSVALGKFERRLQTSTQI